MTLLKEREVRVCLFQSSLFSEKVVERGEDPAGDGATCSRCGIMHRCPSLISLARGAAAWLPSSAPRECLFHWVCVCWGLTAEWMEEVCLCAGACLFPCLSSLESRIVVRGWSKRTRSSTHVSVEQEEQIQEKVWLCVCVQKPVCIITRLPALCLHCCSGYSICQANLNDLVGSEMCHKGALMDEGEHGANDTTTSTCLHSHLMKALTPEAATFNGVCHCQTARRSHASTSEVQMAFWKCSWRLQLARRTSRRRDIHESESKKLKMPAFGDLIERMSNGPRYSAQFIHASSSIWVSVVIMKSLFGRVGLSKLMPVWDYTSMHKSTEACRKKTLTNCVKLLKLCPNLTSNPVGDACVWC